jgi:hypothetical protein
VAAARRRRRTGGVPRALPSRALLFASPAFPPHPRSSNSRARVAKLCHRPHTHVLAGVGRSGHHRSPPATTSRSEQRLHLVHPALASACRGKAPVHGNRSSEPDQAHWRAPLLDSPSPLYLFSYPCAQLVHLGSPVLESHAPCHLLAGDGRPATTHIAAPPCTMMAGFPSSIGHRACTMEFAG